MTTLRYSDDQLALAKLQLHAALESMAVAFWTDEPRFQVAVERHLEHAVTALGYRLVPLPSAAEQHAGS